MLKSLSRRPDIKSFFFQWTNDLIIKMEHNLENFWDIDISRIFDFVKKQKTVGSNKCFFMEKSKELFEVNIANNLVNKTRGTTFYAKFNKRVSQSISGDNDLQFGKNNISSRITTNTSQESSSKESTFKSRNSKYQGLNFSNITNQTEKNDDILSKTSRGGVPGGGQSRNNPYNKQKSVFNLFSNTQGNINFNNQNNFIKEEELSEEDFFSDEDHQLSPDYNNDYFKDLTVDELIERVINEQDEIRKDYLIKQVEKAGKVENSSQTRN